MKKIYLLSILFVFSAVSFSQTFLNSNRDKDGRNYFSFNYQPLLTRSVNQITPDWIYDTKAPILSSLKSADVDGDGIKEIIISTYDTTDGNSYGAGLIYILNIDGTDLDGWPLRMVGAPIPATVSIGDINNDDSLELVVGSWNKLYVYDSQGNNVPGFPKNYGTSQTSTLFDLDKDGTLEIIYPSDDKNLYIFKYDGTLLTGWPQSLTELPGSPAVADIDNDGDLELIFADRSDNYRFGVVSVSTIPDNGNGSEQWTLEASGQGENLNAATIYDMAVLENNILLIHEDGSVTVIQYSNGSYNNLGNFADRSEERRVGKECRSRWSPDH